MESQGWAAKLLRSKGFAYLGTAALVVSIVVVLWRVFRQNPLMTSATQMADAMKDGNGAALLEFAIDDEVRCSNLTPERIRKAWEILMAPRLNSSKLLGKEPTLMDSNGVQATSGYRFQDKEGNPWTLLMIANQAEGEGKTQIIYKMLAVASFFNENNVSEPKLTLESSIRGLRLYRAKLEDIGIHQVMLGPGRCLTWDELQARFRRQLAASKVTH